MGEIFKIFGTIGLNDKEANAGIDRTTKNAQKSTKTIGDHFKNAAKVIGTVFAVEKIISFGKLSVEAAASAEAVQAQFQQVFSQMGPKAQSTIESLGKEFGMLPNRLKEPFTKTTAMFKGLGMDTESAMNQAQVAVTSAADAAAFYDVSYESANSSLTSFIKGNYEGGEAIGLFANDTQMAQYAIQKGLVTSAAEWSKLDEATKQATRLEYAKNMQEQAGAAGQAARESGGYENVMGNLKQAWQDFAVVVGGPILQPVIGGMKTLAEWLTSGAQKLQDFQHWLGENESAAVLIGIALGTLTALLVAYDLQQGASSLLLGGWNIVAGIGGGVTTALGAAFAFLTSPIGLIILAIGAVIAIGYLLVDNWDLIKETTINVFTGVGDFIGRIMDGITGFFQSVIDFVGDNWQGLLLLIVFPFGGAFKLLYDNFEGFRNFVDGIVDSVKGFFDDLGSSIGNIAGNIWESLNNAFDNIVTSIAESMGFSKEEVDSALQFIRDLFNFDFDWPHIPLPHFYARGSWNPIDWLSQGVPKIGVDWYAKGGIMNRPTAFGMNGNNMMVGGEKDKEAILPLNAKNLGMIGHGIWESSDKGILGSIVDRLDTLVEIVRILISVEPKYQLMLDSGALVGSLTPLIDRELSNQAKHKVRGNR